MIKMGGSTKGSKQASVRVVWSQPSRRQYSAETKDQAYQEMWMVGGLARVPNLLCVRSPFRLGVAHAGGGGRMN